MPKLGIEFDEAAQKELEVPLDMNGYTHGYVLG